MEEQSKARKEETVRESAAEVRPPENTGDTNVGPRTVVKFQLDPFFLVIEENPNGLFYLKFTDVAGRTVDALPLTADDLDKLSYDLDEFLHTIL